MKEIDNIYFTKEDFEFTLVGKKGSSEFTAGVKIWIIETDVYHLEGYWDMPNVIEELGDPVTITANADEQLLKHNLPLSVMKEAQNFLFHGLNIMMESNIRVTKKEIDDLHKMLVK